jgi:hypothetical protein
MASNEREQPQGDRIRNEISSGANTPDAGTPKSRVEEVAKSDATISRTDAGSSDR